MARDKRSTTITSITGMIRDQNISREFAGMHCSLDWQLLEQKKWNCGPPPLLAVLSPLSYVWLQMEGTLNWEASSWSSATLKCAFGLHFPNSSSLILTFICHHDYCQVSMYQNILSGCQMNRGCTTTEQIIRIMGLHKIWTAPKLGSFAIEYATAKATTRKNLA